MSISGVTFTPYSYSATMTMLQFPASSPFPYRNMTTYDTLAPTLAPPSHLLTPTDKPTMAWKDAMEFNPAR